MQLQATPASALIAPLLQRNAKRALTSVTGLRSCIAVVFSAWLMAALLCQKDDVEKVIAEFAATIRVGICLDKLSAELLRVIQGTLQPASTSIWIGDPASVRGDMKVQRHSVAEETLV